ncbi:transcriptional regulator, TetR family [Streptoalloteichus tenebrarius]|uniref:Transcriptional regulator, TetR family n=1 Tax=Streptoalloteichus tenebrarius (strain ATCC 17920 / DSM 40477 / JCM 4838 / CBS 697.72 / NBRC 16177 / NCIMB 11028 / NRRL B-12390 / A12253. 1 / ISP 5477) TaxID=1933 RepID=A0ABT1I2V0_STRSD|nr:TetR/AcrR family transcriptional regulator [Streptoalloteichus tenebrarius]MCP2262058.1 transcriptional regulator, TetR family [Streptoalloteichus tenebrarius]
MDDEEASQRVLDAAEALFYERGLQSVGIDDIRSASGVSLKRLYRCFHSKQELVTAYLDRTDRRWRAALADYVRSAADHPRDAILAVFDWLGLWFAEPGFRGCAFINAHGELGEVSPAVAAATRRHKEALLAYLTQLAEQAVPGAGRALANQLLLVVEGSIVTAAVHGASGAASAGRAAAAALLDAAEMSRTARLHRD